MRACARAHTHTVTHTCTKSSRIPFISEKDHLIFTFFVYLSKAMTYYAPRCGVFVVGWWGYFSGQGAGVECAERDLESHLQHVHGKP